ncbi:hypothetical protein COV18_05295 [Candidatus Woesearchaeota archaeon CG10_big_fil_rev_8_21_14_0_10_37_12]|nr:MAG: hypothetical protein COV18_05295 [Candidatus Woesearchaeota archaeon CG10_big_fil_rev_8_21_14_0_10_37_12]
MSEYIWGIVFIFAIIAFSAAGAATILKFNEGSKECEVNSDCRELQYCGSDFKCHEHPNIEQTVVNEWTKPALILGVAIILGALILRRQRKQEV